MKAFLKFIFHSFLLCLISVQSSAQGFSDIIKIEGEYYLIAPSLSIPQDTLFDYNLSMTENNESLFKGEYEIIDDTIQFVKMLNEKPSSVLLVDGETEFNSTSISGQYAIAKIDNIERTRRELTSTKENNIGNCCIDYTYIQFRNGELKKGSFEHSSDDLSFGYLKIIDYYGIYYDVKLYSDNPDIPEYTFSSYKFWNSGYMVVKPGVYKMTIEDEDYGKNYIAKTITVEGGRRYDVSPVLQDDWDSESYEYPVTDYSNRNDESYFFHGTYGSPSLLNTSSNNISNYAFQFGAKASRYSGDRFIHSLSGFAAGTLSYTYIPDDNLLSPQSDLIEQHYTYLTYDLGVSTNLFLGKYRGPTKWRPTIELGAQYSLPLIFRYISRDLTGKYSERWLHKFNDIQVFGKIGLQKGISLFGSYRLFDVVRKNYPQLPVFSVGLAVTTRY